MSFTILLKKENQHNQAATNGSFLIGQIMMKVKKGSTSCSTSVYFILKHSNELTKTFGFVSLKSLRKQAYLICSDF